MKQDVKREDLMVRYIHTPPAAKNPPTGVISQTLPMAAMFMRNRMFSWIGFTIALQHYLNYRSVTLSDDASSPFMSLVLAFISVVSSYMEVSIEI